MHRVLPLCLLVISALVFAAPNPAPETHAYLAAQLWPGDGPPISGAVLIVRNGIIAAAGKRAEVDVPADAVVHDLGSAVIIPGLIVAETMLADKGRDDLHALTPHYRAIDGFDPYADYSRALAGGVTTVQIAPGGKRLMPGQGSVVKLFGDDFARRTLREEESLRIVLGDGFKNPPRIYEPPVGAVSVDRPLEPTRPQLAADLPGAMAGLRATFQAARGADRNTLRGDPFLHTVALAGTARMPLRLTVPGNADVQAALGLAREFDLRLLLVDPAAPTAEQLQAWKGHVDGVVLNPGIRPGSVSEAAAPDESAPAAVRRRRQTPAPAPARSGRSAPSAQPTDETGPVNSPSEVARDLRAAGYRVALKPLSDADLREMLYLCGLFTTHSTPVDALKMLTADAATLLGVADRVGTLAAGKDADFVVLSGEPFGLHTKILTAYVDGKMAFDASVTDKQKVVRAGRILTGAGETVRDGAVLIDGRTIRALGREVSAPPNADEKRFASAVVVPGFLDLGNGLGLGGPLNSAIALNTKLGQRLVVSEPGAAAVRQAGVTTLLLASSAAGTSPVVAFKLGDRFRPIKDPVAIRFTLRGNLTSAGEQLRMALRSGKDYTALWLKYDADLADYERRKKEFDAAKPKVPEKKPEEKKEEKKPEEKKDEKKPEEKKEEKKPEEKKPDEPKPPSKPQTNEALEAYRDLFAGKIPAMVEAKREDAIRLAVTIFRDEFGIRTVLIGADDAYRVADLLAEKGVAVAAGPELVRTVERADVNLPLALALRGVPFGFQSQATTGAKNLPLAVGFAVRHGLGAEDALRGLTSSPGKFLGLDDIGILAVGKDADLVVLSGMPFELSTRVLAVMIDGQWVYQE